MIVFENETEIPFWLELLLSILAVLPIINLFVLLLLIVAGFDKKDICHYAVSVAGCYMVCLMFLSVAVEMVSLKREDLREQAALMSEQFIEDYALQEQINKNKEEQVRQLEELNSLKEQELALDEKIESLTQELNKEVITPKLYNLKLFDHATVKGSSVVNIMESVKEDKVAVLLSTKDFDNKVKGYYKAYCYLLNNTETVLLSTQAYKVPKLFKNESLTSYYEGIDSIYENGTISYVKPHSDFLVRVYLLEDSATTIITFKEVS